MTILYVDDDPDDRQLFVEAVKSIDDKIVCATANDGLDGLSWLESHALPDVVFMDINMPLMNGKICLAEIKNNEKTSQLPVIIFTTSNNPEERTECTKIGAAAYVLKPVSYLQMKNTLSALFKSRRFAPAA
jgi:CheY-like chemotaxis protein